MNAPFVVAQATGTAAPAAPVQTIKLYKPNPGETVVFKASFTGTVKIIFTDIANEKITLFKDNAKQSLHIIFADGSQAIIEPFYDSTGSVLANFIIEVGPNQDLTGAQFALQFPSTVDQAVLPAAGPGAAGQASGANFSDPSVDPLGPSNPLPLLGQEELPNLQFTATEPANINNEEVPGGSAPPTPFEVAGAIGGLVEEEDNFADDRGEIGPSLITAPGNEDPNDVTDSIDPDNPSGLDQDTSSNPFITTSFFGPASTGYQSLATLVTSSSGVPTFSFEVTTGTPVTDTAGNPVTSGTEPVKYMIINPSLVIGFADADGDGAFSAGDWQVFSLTVNASTGDYFFSLNDRIDHALVSNDDGTNPIGAFEETLSLNLAPVVVITDGNGPHTIPDNAFSIMVIDDTPDADDTTPLTEGSSETLVPLVLDDEDLPTPGIGIQNGPGDDGSGYAVSGTLPVLYGADGPSLFADTGVDPLVFSTIVTANGNPLQAVYVDGSGQSDGIARAVIVEWSANADGSGTLRGYALIDPAGDATDSANQFEVFELNVGPAGDNPGYDLTMYAPLYHPVQDDPDTTPDVETEFEDNLGLSFTFTATDFDLDQVSAQLLVSVDDDTGDISVEVALDDSEDPVTLAVLNLDETTDPDGNDTPADGVDTYNPDIDPTAAVVAETESEGGPDNGDTDDIVGNYTPDPTGTNPIGRLETATGAQGAPGELALLFNVDAASGADGLQSLTHAFSFTLTGGDEDGLVATTLSVTQPAEGGNPDSDPSDSDDFTPYFDPTIWLVQVSPTVIEGRADLDGDGDYEDDEIALRFTLLNPSDPSLAQIMVEQFMALDDCGCHNLFDTQLPLYTFGVDEDEGVLGLTYTATITDGDGDTQTASATSDLITYDTTSFNFDDDGPRIDIDTVEKASLSFNLDESIGYPTTNPPETGSIAPDADVTGELTVPNGVDPFGSVSTQPGEVSGLFTDVLEDAGTDGKLGRDDIYSLTLTDAFGNPVAIATDEFFEDDGVETTLKATDPDGNFSSNIIYLFKVSDTVIEGRVDIDGDGYFDDADNVALRITLNDPSAAIIGDETITVDQILAIEHPSEANAGNSFNSYDEPVTLAVAEQDGPIDVTAGIGVTKTAVLVDGDFDVASDSATVNITAAIVIEDDGISVDIEAATFEEGDEPTLTLDESIGLDVGDANAEDDDNGAVVAPSYITAADSTLAIGSVAASDSGGSLNDLFTTPMVSDATDGLKNQSDTTFTFTLTDGDGNVVDDATTGVATQLKATDTAGSPLEGLSAAALTIWLFQLSPTEIVGVVGRNANGSDDLAVDDYVALRVQISGSDLVVEQYLPIEHPDGGSSFDEALGVLLADSDASLGVTASVTVTDGDNDTHTDTATFVLATSTASTLSIEDDGPSTTLSKNLGFFVNEDDLNNFVAGTGFGSAGTSPDDAADGDSAVGDDPNDGSVTNATGGATPVTTITLSSFAGFGTDGPGGFALATITTPVDFGLTSKDNGAGPAETVLIVSDGTTLTGYVEIGGVSGFQAGDRPVFTLELIDSATGELRFTLLDQLDHAAPVGTSDENLLDAPVDLSSYVLVLDADGDQAALAAGSLTFNVQDDVPLSFFPADSTLGNVAGSVSADLDAVGKIGADEPLRIVFDGVANGDPAEGIVGDDLTPTELTSGGNPIFLYNFGLVLVGTTEDILDPTTIDAIGDLDASQFVFTVTLDPTVAGGDDYTFRLIQPIDNGSGFVLETFSGVSGGNTDYFAINQIGVQDVYFTPGGTGTTVNTNANEIGVGGGQNVGAGEALRVEFVTFDPAADLSNLTPANFAAAIDAIYDTTSFNFSTTGIQNGDTSQVKISAINADAATPPGGPAPAGTFAAITEVIITFIDGSTHSFTTTSTFDGHTVTFNGDGTVNITGLESDNTGDDNVQIFTSSGFDRIEILNTGTANNNDGESPFKIASIAIGNTITGDPVEMNFDVRITDHDGDSTVADFNVTVTPPPTLTVSSPAVNEDADNFAVFTLSLSAPATEAIGVNLALADGTANGSGVDYGAAGAGNLQVFVGGVWVDATSATFAIGEDTILVRTPVIDDVLQEANETFTLTATVSSGTTTNSGAAGTATIESDDPNNAPAGANNTVGLSEDVTYVFKASDFGFGDVDGHNFAGVVINTLPVGTAGILRLGNTALAAGAFVTAEQIADGSLIYTPLDNVFGNTGDTSFTFSVRDDGPSGGGNVNQDASPNTMTLDMSNTDFADTANGVGNQNTLLALNAANQSIADSSGTDTVRLDTALAGATTFTDLNFFRTDNNLEITWNSASGGATVTLINQYTSAHEQFGFDDGGSFAGYTLIDEPATAGTYDLDQDLNGDGDQDILAGTAAAETLDGGGSDDLLFGNGGDDILDGGDGRDLLVGGLGDDTLRGGAGRDVLVGGDGNDTYRFDDGEGSANLALADVIADFDTTSDIIDLSLVDSGPGGGDQNFSDAGNGGFTQSASVVARGVTWSQSGADTIVRMDTTGDTNAEMLIVLTGVNANNLSASNFTG